MMQSFGCHSHALKIQHSETITEKLYRFDSLRFYERSTPPSDEPKMIGITQSSETRLEGVPLRPEAEISPAGGVSHRIATTLDHQPRGRHNLITLFCAVLRAMDDCVAVPGPDGPGSACVGLRPKRDALGSVRFSLTVSQRSGPD